MAKKDMAPEEYQRLLNAAKKKTHKLMFQLMACGLRTKELVNLKVDDIDFERGFILVRKESSKNGKERKVFYPEAIAPLLEFIKDRPHGRYNCSREGVEEEPYLFVNQWNSGKPLTTKYIRTIFAQTCKDAGIEGYSPHSLRHYAAESMVRAKVPLDFIRQQLGHSSLNITQIYLTNNLEERKKAFETSGWTV